MINKKLPIHDIFNLADGSSVLACEGIALTRDVAGVKATLSSDHGDSQEIFLTGMRTMLNQRKNMNICAIEFKNDMGLQSEDLKKGKWHLII